VLTIMKAQELRELNDAELEQKGRELVEELFNLRFQLATGQIEKVGRINTVRRDIARVKTIQRERELQAMRRS
jgi:large subunit ribosomal protein L29